MMRLLGVIFLVLGCQDKHTEVVSEDLIDTGTAYTDADGDGTSVAAGDCDDTDPSISPDAIEICDGADNNCDGDIDEGVTTAWYADSDGDGYGADDTRAEACAAPAGYIPVGGDCDDADDAVSPGAVEICNAIDDDCDGLSTSTTR